MKLKCVVVDDEPLARDLIVSYVLSTPELELIAECSNALEAQSYVQSGELDLLFLDIEMPLISGMDFLRSMKNPPKVIITTAYSEYAVQGFEQNVLDYLVKPISFDRFYRAVSRAFPDIPDTPVVDKSQEVAKDNEYLFVKANNRIHRVRFNDILFVEGANEYLKIHTASQKFMALLSLSKLFDSLPQGEFIRTHRSFIVHINKIDSIEGNTINIGDHQIPISKGKKEEFNQMLTKKGLL